jgi:hypothetical protein
MKLFHRNLLTGASHHAFRHTITRGAATFQAPYRARFKNGVSAPSSSSIMAADRQAQAAIIARAVPTIQALPSQAIAGNNTAVGQTYNFNMNPVGLNTKITIEISGTINIAAAETLQLTKWGLANILSNIQVVDLSNYTRVNTTGWHLHALACLRRQNVFGAAFLNDSPGGSLGSNVPVNNGPAVVDAATGAKTFRFFYEIPLAYHERSDLSGSIWANVTNATWRTSITFNPAFVAAAAAADPQFSVFQSTTADVGILSGVTVTIYQHFYNQLPMNGSQQTLPLLALATNYLINSTAQGGMAAGTDFPVNYANYRTFLSTIAIYDNAGTLNPGTDVNYMGISVANLTFIEKLDPFMSSLRTRNLIGADFPAGTYVFDHRAWPILTNQFGNTQLVLNASAVTAGATLYTAWEALAQQNQAIMGGALPASA